MTDPLHQSQVRCPRCGGGFEKDAVCTYCHHGVRFGNEGYLAAPKDDLPCPRCQGHTLWEISFRGVAIDVCPGCGGAWFDIGELEQVAHAARAEAKSGHFRPSGSSATGAGPTQSADIVNPTYVRCPHCAQFMTRRNWERRSGVIVDFCKDHGIWLDGGELARIRSWSAQHPDGAPAPLPEPSTEVKVSEPGWMSMETDWRGMSGGRHHTFGGDLLHGLLGVISALFRY